MTADTDYATLYDLRELAKRAPYVTQQDVLDIAAMPVADLRRRALVARDWHGHFAHCLDGIKEIRAMPGAAPDGCWSHKEVRSVVEQLVARCPYTWEDTCFGRRKDAAPEPERPASACGEEPLPVRESELAPRHAEAGPLLQLDALLGALVTAVLAQAQSGQADDLAGVEEVKAVQKHVRRMLRGGIVPDAVATQEGQAQ